MTRIPSPLIEGDIEEEEQVEESSDESSGLFDKYLKDAAKYTDLIEALPDRDCPLSDADYYAVQFLKAGSEILFILREIGNELIMHKQTRNIAESEAWSTTKPAVGEKKTEHDRKYASMIDTNFLDAEKIYQEGKNTEAYFEKLYDTFSAAHKYYRDLARDKT